MSKVPGSGSATFRYGHRRAVIVGIDYLEAGKNIGKSKSGLVAQLKNAQNDATAFYEVLRNLYGYQEEEICLLVGKAATRATILEQFESLLTKNVEEEDSVLFFFSGHGVSFQSEQDKSIKGELVPFDFQYQDGDSSPQNLLGIDYLVRELQDKCKARHKLLILDCCYAGSVFSQGVTAASAGGPAALSLGGRMVTRADGIRSDDSIFKIHGFQAMTSSSLQPAGDSIKRGSTAGESKHSPFTDALLKSLDYLPRQKGAGAVLTTSQVFSGMQRYLDANLGENQTPRCSWLDAGQGEFHFFLEGTLPELKQSEEDIHKNMIAMVPGSFGNWWFDECPWFIPALRYRILEQTESSRSVLFDIRTPSQLKQAAERMLATLKKEIQSDKEMLQQLGDMEKLMYGSDEIWRKNARGIMERLDARRKELEKEDLPSMKGVDLHFLAVLRHALRENVTETRELYNEAISTYQKESEANHQSRAMLAMCQADFGWFEFDVANDFDEASQHFADALSSYGAMTPQPFSAYVLCRDAEAQLRLGREGVAAQRLAEALSVILEVDRDQKEPMTAAYYHRRAWVQMAGCQFSKAAESFQESSKVLAKQSLAEDGSAEQDIEAIMMDLNNSHGLALILRFQGERDQAISQYRTLYNRIVKHFRDRRDSDSRDANYRQTKTRLAEQLVNALEQMGDCSLFCYPSDVAEAADDYRRAIRTCGFLPMERRKRWEDRIRYKFALSLVLPGASVQDPEMASLQLMQIESAGVDSGMIPHPPTGEESISAQVADRQPDGEKKLANSHEATSERSIHLCGGLTRLLLAIDARKKQQPGDDSVRLAQEKQIQDILKDLRTEIRSYLSDERLNKSLSRDDLEVSMFCLRTMLQDMKEDLQQIDQATADTAVTHAAPEQLSKEDEKTTSPLSENRSVLSSRLQRYNDLETLLGFCRASRRGGAPVTRMETGGNGSEPRTLTLTGGDSLAFSRPYYDCAMQALIELKPANAKQLIEVAHEAMTGDTHRKSSEPEATLTVYCSDSSCYLLLDVPRSTSRYFILPGNINAATIQHALDSRDIGKSRLDLPPEAYKELAIAALQDLPVSVCWRDPVQKIGLSGTQELVIAARPLSPADGEPALLPVMAQTQPDDRNVEGLFPFRVPAGLQLRSAVPKAPLKAEQKVVTSVK